MLGNYVNAVFRWLRRVISQPREELNRCQQTVRFAYDLGRFGARQLHEDRAPQMAAALAFRALFGLVPVLVVATILVRAVIGVDEFLAVIREVSAWMGLDDVRIAHPGGNGTESKTLADWLGNLISEAAGIRLTAIGWVGIAVLSYAAVSLLVTIENAFNIIYRAHDGRPWTMRVPLYWFLLTVSPIVFGLGTWLNSQFETWLNAADIWPWTQVTARLLWAGFCGWIVLLSVYMLLPNTQVRFRPAAAGAIVGVILLETGKRVLGTALQNTLSISHLYGSLGLIPLFMFWTYLMWLAVLMGLQVSAILQMLKGRRLEELEHRRGVSGLLEPASVITVMEVIAERFAQGAVTTPDELSLRLAVPRSTVVALLDRLTDQGLVHRQNETGSVALACPAEQISAGTLLEIGFAMLDESGAPRASFPERLRDVQRDAAGQHTLAHLLHRSPA